MVTQQGTTGVQTHEVPAASAHAPQHSVLYNPSCPLHLPWAWKPGDKFPLASSEILTVLQALISGTLTHKESRVWSAIRGRGRTVLLLSSIYGFPLAAGIAKPQSPLWRGGTGKTLSPECRPLRPMLAPCSLCCLWPTCGDKP